MSDKDTQGKSESSRPEQPAPGKPGLWWTFFRRWRRRPLYALFRMTILSLAVAGIFLYGFYQHYREDIRALVLDLVQSQSGRLLEPKTTFSRMDMPSFGQFVFHNLRISDPFEPQRYFLEARRVKVEIDPLRLIWRGINLGLLSIEGASVWIHRDSLQDKYNIERLFRQSNKKDDTQAPKPTGPGLRVRIRDFRIQGARVLLEDIDKKPIDNTVYDVHGTLTRIDGENVIEVIESRLSTDYRGVGQAAISGIVTFGDGRLGLQEIRVQKGQTVLTGAGWVNFTEKTYLYEIEPGTLDLSHLPRELGLEKQLTGTVGLSASFSGKFDSTFIQADISLERGTLFEYPVHNLSTQITYTADNLGFARIRSGVAGGGLEGKVEFSFTRGKEGYLAEIQVLEIDVSRLKFHWSEDVRGRISGIVDLRGSGYDPDRMEMEIRGRSIRGHMFDIPIDSCRVEYNYRQGRSRIDNLVIHSEGAVATAIGDIDPDSLFLFVLVEQFPASRLAEWVPAEGLGGTAEFSGSLNGKLDDPSLNGTFSVSEGSYKDISFAMLEGSCELRNLVSGINGNVEAQFSEVSMAGRDIESIHINGAVPDSGAIRFDPLIVIENNLNNLYSVGYYLPGERPDEHSVTLDTLNLNYSGMNVTSRGTSVIFRHGDTTSVENMDLSVLGGSLNGDMVLSDSGWFDSNIGFSNLDLSLLPAEFKPQFPVSGLVSGKARLEGTLEKPTGAVTLKAIKPVISVLLLDSLAGRLHLDRSALRIDTLLLFSVDNASTLSGLIPFQFDSTGVAVTGGTEITLNARLNSFPISSIRTPTVPLTAGLIDGELNIRGSRVKPVMSGELKLTGGAGLIAPINTRLQNMSGRVVLEPGGLRLLDMVSNSPEGKLQASGQISLDGLKPERLDIQASGRDMVLQQFRYVTSLRVNADLKLQGPVGDLALNGAVRVVEGEVNPPLGGAPTEEEADVEASPQVKLPVLPFDYDVQIMAPEDFWLRNRNTGIKLAANIRAAQKDSVPTILGQITTVSGYYSVFGRRFQIKYGSIQFQGEDVINPLLDINAERTIRGRVLRSELAGSSYGLRGSTAGGSLPSEQYEMDSNTFVLHIGGTLNNPQIEIFVYDQNRREIEPPITPEMARTLVLLDQTYREFNQQSGMSQSKLLDQAANLALSQANPYLQEWTGLDEFSIESQFFTRTPGENQTDETAGATLTVGEFLFEKVFFSFSQDLVDPSARSAQIDYLINQNSSIIVQTDSRGHFSVDFRYLYKY